VGLWAVGLWVDTEEVVMRPIPLWKLVTKLRVPGSLRYHSLVGPWLMAAVYDMFAMAVIRVEKYGIAAKNVSTPIRSL
jgi:hypothetical protein